MYQSTFRKGDLEVIHNLSLNVRKGEILAVVGSSGSGKSILASAILGLLPVNHRMHGEILYKGEPLDKKSRSSHLGKEIAYIPQSVDFLDPLMKVGRQVIGVSGTAERQKELFSRFGLSPQVAEMYPHELSGGMARRVLICAAMMGKPDLLVADEPTPGLDIQMALETLRTVRKIADEGAAIMLITHDINLAFQVADRIAVFYAGTIVEIEPTKMFLAGKEALLHPYSRAFIDALPQNDFKPISGIQPYAGALPSGCLFSPRCPWRDEKCEGKIPMRTIGEGNVRCVHAAER